VSQVDDNRNKQIMASNIKRYMEMKGVTNQQLCDALDFKYTTFMDWIKGVTYPRIGKVEAMANYFGCEKSDLIEEKLTEEIKKDNDTISSIVVRMTMDKDFLAVVESLYALDPEQIKGIQGMLKAFNKDL
jgi:transcriptional regulator with XRE-family HTH domain